MLRPAFSRFVASSRLHPASSRIPGRQGVAAVVSVVALAEQGLRLAARCPLSHWHCAADVGDNGKGGSADEQEHPWEFCTTLATAGARWLRQSLPARHEGQEPARLISMVEEGAVLGTFKSLLGLLATQVCTRLLLSCSTALRT